jgi:peptidoglycan hydrolase CwlO-like protein
MTLPWGEKLIRPDFIVALLVIFGMVATFSGGYAILGNKASANESTISEVKEDVKSQEDRIDKQDVIIGQQTTMIKNIEDDVKEMKQDIKDILKLVRKQ